jgi:hypothetical protein
LKTPALKRATRALSPLLAARARVVGWLFAVLVSRAVKVSIVADLAERSDQVPAM